MIMSMKEISSKVKPIIWQDGELLVLDQRLLPHEKKYLKLISYKQVIDVIKNMVVRGAPLIGITAGYGMTLAAYELKSTVHDSAVLIEKLRNIGEEIKQSRPTAINLNWAVDLILRDINNLKNIDEIVNAIEKRAIWIHEDDAKRCQKIGELGAKIIPKSAGILTICNTGALATGGIGTAFGVILTAYNKDKSIKVYALETRPRQQGARLTTYECMGNNLNFILVADTASGYLMQKREINVVIAGADRIAANGDTANKIGTYQLAVLAKENNIPFYIAAPLSTFDLSIKNGEEIPIEERDEKEITTINKGLICASGTKARNPAFDITPAQYIAGIITEKGILSGSYREIIRSVFNTPAIV